MRPALGALAALGAILVFAMGIIVLVAAAADVQARGRRAWRDSVPLLASMVGAMGVFAYFAANPATLRAA